MESVPTVPGSSAYPGARQRSVYRQRMADRDLVINAAWISVAILAAVALGLMLQMLRP